MIVFKVDTGLLEFTLENVTSEEEVHDALYREGIANIGEVRIYKMEYDFVSTTSYIVDTTYGKDQEKMTLWSDGKTNEEIQKLAESDSSSVAYNLHEDLLCVKEDLAKANKRIAELTLSYEILSEECHDFKIRCAHAESNCEYAKMHSKEFAIEKKIEAFEKAQIPRHAKAGCIGEFKFNIEGANCCPECYHDKKDDCELCEGDTDENGLSDLTATVPWDLCKEIWLRMNKIYAEQLRKGGES